MSDISDNDYSGEEVDEEMDEEETERVILDPGNVRERIDATLESLATVKSDKSRTISRSDLMETLTK
jgi:hypothetical protein